MSKVISIKRVKAKSGTVAALMTRPAVTVRPDLSLESLQDLFVERGLSRVPVVDGRGRAVGVIAKTDLINDRADALDTSEEEGPVRGSHVHAEPRTVEELMTKNVVTVRADAPLWIAAELMADRALHGVPVVDTRQVVVGMLSSLDFVRFVARGKGS